MPILKKIWRLEQKIYRPVVHVLPFKDFWENYALSNEYFFEDTLSKYYFGVRQGHSSNQCLLVQIWNWKNCLD